MKNGVDFLEQLSTGTNNYHVSSERVKQTTIPNIYMILMINITFSVTICACERSFSDLKRVKSFDRMTQYKKGSLEYVSFVLVMALT